MVFGCPFLKKILLNDILLTFSGLTNLGNNLNEIRNASSGRYIEDGRIADGKEACSAHSRKTVHDTRMTPAALLFNEHLHLLYERKEGTRRFRERAEKQKIQII